MSYWIYLHHGHATCFEQNMTSNVAPVWDELGVHFRDMDGWSARRTNRVLARAIKKFNRMTDVEVDHLHTLVRGGGTWGNVSDAIRLLIDLQRVTSVHTRTSCKLRVSH